MLLRLARERSYMKKLSILLLVLFVSIMSAGCSPSTITIKRADLGKGYDSRTQEVVEPTTTFGPTDILHCVIELTNAPEGTLVRVVWAIVDATDASGAVRRNEILDEATFATQDANTVLNATLALPASGQWPTGKYKVDIYLNGNLDSTLEFSVAE